MQRNEINYVIPLSDIFSDITTLTSYPPSSRYGNSPKSRKIFAILENLFHTYLILCDSQDAFPVLFNVLLSVDQATPS